MRLWLLRSFRIFSSFSTGILSFFASCFMLLVFSSSIAAKMSVVASMAFKSMLSAIKFYEFCVYEKFLTVLVVFCRAYRKIDFCSRQLT